MFNFLQAFAMMEETVLCQLLVVNLQAQVAQAPWKPLTLYDMVLHSSSEYKNLLKAKLLKYINCYLLVTCQLLTMLLFRYACTLQRFIY